MLLVIVGPGPSRYAFTGEDARSPAGGLLGDRHTRREGGPRRLADELLVAWDQWTDEGLIRLYDYGMTVTATEQYVWAGDPDTGRRWPVRDPEPIGS
jgi:hypothetical protein